MPKQKFPSLIHVTREQDGGESWLQVEETGVARLDEHYQVVAIYKLVSLGRVAITKKFIPGKR